ncbi:GNAT family acetyltransferase [Bacillus canaveralius]|uniref:GNAT family acetyltransferase n=1 Tax=Bacillus canaveralius TaxID=1403243 RepID=A0A2N5GIQ8_9BACI|nr:GNAT family acetyltransferase [Bacillus canaveralius]PLR80910.1 GNAT family acetyltransferase [Bacillus canaveralius]PLR91198.1 GNAT family acetyltransferase [Bacillus canaveralius]RSK52660.1 GNAT family N-acetyltransferase [Bacillus canaveralius]
MKYLRITSIEDPLFRKMHNLMQEVFPPEEVLEYELWKEPLEDPGIRVFVAVHGDDVAGATEYRYYPDWNIAMTDFTIIGRPGLSLGRFLAQNRQNDLNELAKSNGKKLFGMFAEIYDPYKAGDHEFGGVKAMNPFVRREVLSHLGYKRLDFTYVHPSWKNDGEAVTGLDLCFMPDDENVNEIPAQLVVDFLKNYYTVLPNKPSEWLNMVEQLERQESVLLLPL